MILVWCVHARIKKIKIRKSNAMCATEGRVTKSHRNLTDCWRLINVVWWYMLGLQSLSRNQGDVHEQMYSSHTLRNRATDNSQHPPACCWCSSGLGSVAGATVAPLRAGHMTAQLHHSSPCTWGEHVVIS